MTTSEQATDERESRHAATARLGGRRATARLIDRLSRSLIVAMAVVAALFLIAPMIVVVITSFNIPPSLSVPPDVWSTDSYTRIPTAMYESFATSVKLALVATIISLSLTLPAAFWIGRTRTRSSKMVDSLFRSPLQVPQVIVGISLFQTYVLYQTLFGVGLRGSFAGLVAAHVILVVPYVLATCVSQIESIGIDFEQAAENLGASSARIFFRVNLPMIRQAVIAAALLSVLVSFGNVPLSLFLASPSETPLPVRLFNISEQNLTPLLYAVATLAIAFSLVAVAVLDKLVGLRTALKR